MPPRLSLNTELTLGVNAPLKGLQMVVPHIFFLSKIKTFQKDSTKTFLLDENDELKIL
jgi:hypothetical protein